MAVVVGVVVVAVGVFVAVVVIVLALIFANIDVKPVHVRQRNTTHSRHI
jgi:hypothetical protein